MMIAAMKHDNDDVRTTYNMLYDITANRAQGDPLLGLAIQLLERELRSTGVTKKYISIRSGVSETTLNAWLRGKTKNPQAITVQFVLKALGYRLDLVKEGEIDYG